MKLALGSAQFGMTYGIANSAGRPPESEIVAILRAASAAGMECIDTAPAYGESEALLGRALPQVDAPWRIVSKIPAAVRKSTIGPEHARMLRRSFEDTLRRLCQPRLHGLLMHNAEDLLAPGGELLFRELAALKVQSLVRQVGVSVYEPETALRILSRFPIDLVQLPVNLFDQRAVTSGQLKKLKAASVEIHARSAFLQGLFFLQPNSLPAYISQAKAQLARLQDKAAARGVSVQGIALGYLDMIDEIDVILVGVESVAQLRENLRAYAEPRLGPEDYAVFACTDEHIINPNMWQSK